MTDDDTTTLFTRRQEMFLRDFPKTGTEMTASSAGSRLARLERSNRLWRLSSARWLSTRSESERSHVSRYVSGHARVY